MYKTRLNLLTLNILYNIINYIKLRSNIMTIIGGLNSVPDVKVLVLYILNYAGAPLLKDNIINIALSDGLVQYFDLVQAIDEMLITGLIDITGKDTPDVLRITELGRQTLGLFEKTLPHSIRRKNQTALLKMLADIERARNVKSNIEKKSSGFEVTCTLIDGDDVLLEYKLLVPTQIQAQLIVEQFEKNSTEKYKSILQLLVDEKLFEDEI